MTGVDNTKRSPWIFPDFDCQEETIFCSGEEVRFAIQIFLEMQNQKQLINDFKDLN